MALGALIGAYQEDEAGGLRALLPLAGRTLIEYQARCLAALGAAPVLVLVERVPVALNDAFERLRGEGIAVVAVSDGERSREPVRGGHRPHPARRRHRSRHGRPRAARWRRARRSILTVPDDDAHAGYERIDATHRWAGLARLPAALVGATAAMLGDWDLQSTLLRRAVQAGARLVPRRSGEGAGPFLADGEAMAAYERRLLLASRGRAHATGSAAIMLPIVEEVATERLMETRLRPAWLVRVALLLTLARRSASRAAGSGGACRVGRSRPRSIWSRSASRCCGCARSARRCRRRRLLWPAAGLALVALGWFEARHGGGWGAMVAALGRGGLRRSGTDRARASSIRLARSGYSPAAPRSGWRSRSRSAAGGTSISALIALYAAASFFMAQYIHHRVARD